MRKVIIIVSVVLLLYYRGVVVVDGHLCMWTPHQRGPLDISSPGNRACYGVNPPCGTNYTAGPVTAKLTGGSTFEVEFQQNLNHWYPKNPGYMIAGIAPNDKGVFTKFGDIIMDYPANDMVTQTNFTIKGVVPNIDCKSCVLRVQYVSNNLGEGENTNVFSQCADILIVKS